MKLLTTIVALIASTAFSLTVQAGNAAAGGELAGSCGGCHGAKGEGQGANPPINTLSEADFVAALESYADGSRNYMMMNMLTANLSKAQMQDLAAYYASLK